MYSSETCVSITMCRFVAGIWRECRCVSPGHLDLEGLFLVNGNAERVDWLRQRYDSGEEVELEKEADLASAVSLLRLFLQELPEPVIPTEIQRHILQLHQGVWQPLLLHYILPFFGAFVCLCWSVCLFFPHLSESFITKRSMSHFWIFIHFDVV